MPNGPIFDSDTRPRDDEARAVVAEDYDSTILISRGSTTTNQHFHVPTEEGTPRCGKALLTAEWVATSLAVYPPGHGGWCDQCLAYLFPERANINVNPEVRTP